VISIKTSFKTSFILKLVLIYLASVANTFADDSLSSGIDCSEIDINYADNPDLTRAERIAAMEAAFYESVNRFETCNLSNSSQAASQSGGQSGNSGSGASDGSEADGDNEGNNAEGAFESVASPVLSGTEIDIEPPEFDSSEPTTEEVTTISAAGANGAKPEDIPDANNDDAVAAQIRLAAELEKDPEKKEKLWDEYRKYKGITKK
jgi:hypothetical protein